MNEYLEDYSGYQYDLPDSLVMAFHEWLADLWDEDNPDFDKFQSYRVKQYESN